MGLLLLLSMLLPSPETFPFPPPPLFSLQGAARVLALAKGSVLVHIVYKGMPFEVVHNIPGNETSEAAYGSSTFYYPVSTFWDSQGITVSWHWIRAADGTSTGKYKVKKAVYDWHKWVEWGN